MRRPQSPQKRCYWGSLRPSLALAQRTPTARDRSEMTSDQPLTILIAARDEEEQIGATVAALQPAFPGGEVIAADDGSRDGTARAATEAGAVVIELPARGKGQALSAAEQAAPPGRLLLVDADLRGDLTPLLRSEADLAIAAFARQSGGGFGVTKRMGRALVRLRPGYEPREPLS